MEYYIGIDESGITNNHKQKINKVKNNCEFNHNEKTIIITMIFISKPVFDYLNFEIQNLKINYFKTQNFTFHSYYFFNYQLKYNQNYRKFIYSFLKTLEKKYFRIYQIKINTKSFYQKYKNFTKDPYYFAVTLLFEKIFNFYKLENSKIFIETRGKINDKKLLNVLKNNFSYSYNIWKSFENIYFLRKVNTDYYLLIEIADLISYFGRWFLNNKTVLSKNDFVINKSYFENFIINKNIFSKEYKTYWLKIIK